MKKTGKMSMQQRDYTLALACLQTLESLQAQAEREYIISHGIVNDDGVIPGRLHDIGDDCLFERASSELDRALNAIGFPLELQRARKSLKAAEDELLHYTLTLVPAGTREELAKAAAKNYTKRQKLIGTAMKLDASTVTI